MKIEIIAGIFILVASILIDLWNAHRKMITKQTLWYYWVLLLFAMSGYGLFLELCFSFRYTSLGSVVISLVISILVTFPIFAKVKISARHY